MAIRVVRKGNASVNNDHDLLFNRGNANQHPIEAITGLKEALAEKYIKPHNGIPASDLEFNVVTQENLNDTVAHISEKFVVIDGNIVRIDSDIQSIKDIMSMQNGNGASTINGSTVNFAYREGFREEFISQHGDTEFHLINRFVADNKHLKVYRDGELLVPTIDYVEESDNNIKMTYPLEEGVYMSFICDSMSTVLSPIHEEIICLKDQVEFELKNQYKVGSNILSIFAHGMRLELNSDYLEVSPNKIKLIKQPFNAGDKLIFRQEGIQNAGQILYHEKDYQQKTWSFEFIAKKGQTIIDIPETYIPGANMIMVSIDGLLAWAGAGFDYIELDDKRIKFNYELDDSEKIRITCIAALCNWTERFVSVQSQTKFKLSNVYYTGRDDIMVYENGLQLLVDEDYKEISNNVIEFTEAPPFGSRITVMKRR